MNASSAGGTSVSDRISYVEPILPLHTEDTEQIETLVITTVMALFLVEDAELDI